MIYIFHCNISFGFASNLLFLSDLPFLVLSCLFSSPPFSLNVFLFFFFPNLDSGSENQINHMSWIMLIAAAVCWAPGSRPQAEIRWYGLILGSAGVEGKRKKWDGAGRGGEAGHLPGGKQGEAVPSQASSQQR